jgi:hypothetical protein
LLAGSPAAALARPTHLLLVDGVSGGTQTGRVGCKQFELASGDDEFFCMTVGGTNCPSSRPSRKYPGSTWVACTPDEAAGSPARAEMMPARNGPQVLEEKPPVTAEEATA